MLVEAHELAWREAPQKAIILAEKCAATTRQVRQAIQNLPQDGFLALWYDQPGDTLQLNVGDWIDREELDQWQEALEPLASKLIVMDEAGGPDIEGSIKIAMRPLAARAFLEKRAESPTLSALTQGLGMRPGVIPGTPNKLVPMLTTGLLGAGLGYGAGWLGEKLLPEQWRRRNLRRSLTLAGGLGGAGLGFVAGSLNWGGPTDSVESHMGRLYDPDTDSFPKNPNYTSPRSTLTMPELEPFYGKTTEAAFHAAIEKQAFGGMTAWMGNGELPPIRVPDFHAAVNLDPRVRNRLPPSTRAAATGLVTGAGAIGGDPQLVSPLDVGRMAAGMGSGYLSGMLVGKVLGTLTGMPPNTQEKLKNTGMWAGALANVLPLAFR